ncbi:MAG: 4-hydroxybenzoate octaprenyltransferase [Alistipes sp.]|nr:4-hydroxybenzoate octaprenyltransferase [Alistipes sp.]MBQ3027287.1 4-hydroxybenzoate octaprenyltransferase [Alistipes sp.]
MFESVSKYLRLVKFSHTIFAMPFALVAFAYALWSSDAEFSWWLLLQVVLCMVFARNVAMGFNRWADRDIDKENPRTASREIPSGQISPRNALAFVIINALLFVATASTINLLTALLSPVALAVVMFYSYCKRFTSLAHLVLGLSLAIAPAGAYIAVTGTLTFAPCLLSLVVLTWTGGFDIIYALQDAAFDRERGLHSIPSRFSVATSLYISIALHCVSVAALILFATYLPQGWLLWCGVGLFTAILVAEHILVTPTRQRSIGIAFGTLNGLASLTLALFVIANIIIFG